MSWRNAKLGDVVRFLGGGTPSKKNPNYWGGAIPWATVKDIKGPVLEHTIDSITEEGLRNSASRVVSSGTVIIPTRMALGKATITAQPMAINQDLKAAIPTDALDPKYLLHYFRSESETIERLGAGATVKGVTLDKLARLEIPLPSLDEQKRVAAVLDKADALRRQRQDSLQLSENLLQSIFIDMFVRNPAAADWTTQRVEWMAKGAKGSIRTGPFGSQLLHSEFVDRGIAVLGIDNAVENRFEWGQPRFITAEKYQSLRRYKVFPGDLIITIMGTLGRCAIVPDDIPEAINTKHLCCITLDRDKCIPEFLHAAFLNHPLVRRQLGVRTKGAVMPGLNMGIIKELEFPMPPVELQKEFKRVVDLCAASSVDLKESQRAAEALFGSLQQRAFRGELDLSRLILEEEVEAIERAADKLHQFVHLTLPKTVGRKHPNRAFVAPPEIELTLKLQDATVQKGSPIPWSLDYFRYRILAAQPAPFSFADLMQKAEAIFEEPPPYETIRELIFDLLGQDGKPASLRQRFDLQTNEATNEVTGRKEIVFEPVP